MASDHKKRGNSSETLKGHASECRFHNMRGIRNNTHICPASGTDVRCRLLGRQVDNGHIGIMYSVLVNSIMQLLQLPWHIYINPVGKSCLIPGRHFEQ